MVHQASPTAGRARASPTLSIIHMCVGLKQKFRAALMSTLKSREDGQPIALAGWEAPDDDVCIQGTRRDGLHGRGDSFSASVNVREPASVDADAERCHAQGFGMILALPGYATCAAGCHYHCVWNEVSINPGQRTCSGIFSPKFGRRHDLLVGRSSDVRKNLIPSPLRHGRTSEARQ